MKYIARSLLVVGSLLLAGTASAEFATDWNPYIGLDYYHVWMKGKSEAGSAPGLGFENFAPTSYPGMSVYVGSRFNDCLGIELGGSWSFQQTRRRVVPVVNPLTGLSVDTTTSTRVNRWGLHADLVGFLPVAECFDLFGSIGIGYVNANVRTVFTNVPIIAGVNVNGTAISRSFNSAVFRLGVGASYMVTECVGLRAKVGWETTSSLRNTRRDDNLPRTRAFRDSFTLNVGAFMRF